MSSARETIQAHYAASARGDVAGMVADFDPDVAWTEMAGFPYAGTFHGPDAVIENVFGRLGREWEDYQAVPDQLVAEGDDVVAFGFYTGGCRATGRQVKARFTHHWTLRDGKVIRFEQFTDTALFRDAMQ